jgi:hypothetical protein
MVTDTQVRKLRRKMSEGKTQEAGAAAAGMSERSAQTWKRGALPSERKKERWWRTRPDGFASVWETEVVALLQADKDGVLESLTILEHLQERHPGRFTHDGLRTLQRRVRDWRALHGPEKEIFFQQDHAPGKEAAFDFTHCTDLDVTIRGEPLKHLLFQWVLSFSKWVYACVAFGETYEALAKGLQDALWKLGGVPEVGRSDNMSAATHELRRGKGRGLTVRFASLLDHYGMRSTRINPGESHENGVVEKQNDLTKNWLRQALVLRGNREFDSVKVYEEFVVDVIDRKRNRLIDANLQVERLQLKPLPSSRVPDYTTSHPKVTCWSTIQVNKRPYSVPSRLMGHVVEARQHADVVEVYQQKHLIETMPRVRDDNGSCINYRHVIWSLVRKPGAFAQYRYREALFPTLVFRQAYDTLLAHTVRADVEYVRILHLAASTMESVVETALVQLLQAGAPFDYVAVQQLAQPHESEVPVVSIGTPDLSVYDRLLVGGAP